MAKGLDVGTMNIVAAYQQGDKTVINQQRNSFLEMEGSEVTASMLQQSKILHMKFNNNFIIVGEDALKFSNVMNSESRRPMSKGILSRDEKQAIPMMKLIIERLLGPPAFEGEIVYFTSPGNPVDVKANILYHQKILEAVLRKLGYTPKVVNEALCVIYAEMGKDEFTGMGLSFGAGMVNCALSHLGVPLTSFSIARGGDWIDWGVSDSTGVTKDKVTATKEEQLRLDQGQPGGNQVLSALAIFYDNLIDYSVRHIENQLRLVNVDEGLTIPVTVTGGTSSPKGFLEAYTKRLKAATLPFGVTDIRAAKSNLFTVGLGALVGAKAYEAEQGLGARATKKVAA